jgi:hypothetical protein
MRECTTDAAQQPINPNARLELALLHPKALKKDGSHTQVSLALSNQSNPPSTYLTAILVRTR